MAVQQNDSETYGYKFKLYGWMDLLDFKSFFNSSSVISGRLNGEYDSNPVNSFGYNDSLYQG